MEKRWKAFRIVIAVVCVLSLTLNGILIVNHDNAKRSFFAPLYQNLMNVDILLASIHGSVSGRLETNRDYLLSDLKDNCEDMDRAMNNLGAIKIRDRSVPQFNNFYYVIEDFVSAGDADAIAAEREKLQAYIAELTLDGQYDWGNNPNPDYSLSIEDIFYQTNYFLRGYPVASRH